MNNIFRGLIAGYGAKKLGGGCFSTILVFIVIWYALGHCGSGNNNQNSQPRVQQNISKPVNPVVLRD